MGYHPMTAQDMYEIIRRWHSHESISSIARQQGWDRKSVRGVVRKAQEHGVKPEAPLPTKEILVNIFEEWKRQKSREKEIYDSFVRVEDQIKSMIEGTMEMPKMKPKTAWQALYDNGEVTGSYGTFKTFIRRRGLTRPRFESPLRIELPPGEEAQLDYGKMGLLMDPVEGRRRVVNGFVMVLSCSRLPFIEFTFSQNAMEFAENIRSAFEFYGGTVERLSLDNLKSGVIKPNLYDPKLNRTFQELLEHYGCFADPCRVGEATDKGKVERQIPVSRELFAYLRYRYPAAGLAELNRHAKEWCLTVYGMRKHGTTGLKPREAFEEVEKKKLKALPAERFETARWREYTVHPDRSVRVDGKGYCMPENYVGRKVWTRRKGRFLAIYDGLTKVREYLVTAKRYSYLAGDFPKEKEEIMRGRYPSYLMSEATAMGPEAEALMRSVLEPHAYVRGRRGRGILEVMRKYHQEKFFEKIVKEARERRITMPGIFEQLMKDEADQLELFPDPMPVSIAGQTMIRECDYYFKQEEHHESKTSSRSGAETVEVVRDVSKPRHEAEGGDGERHGT